LDEPPPPVVPRGIVDHPACTRDEYNAILSEFEHQLESIVGHCERIGALPILIIPAGNEGGFEPSRSCLDPKTTKSKRQAFTRSFARVRALEQSDPEEAIRAYRALILKQPRFAESHYRLARLLEAKKDWQGARDH